jgi:hypothetical protein
LDGAAVDGGREPEGSAVDGEPEGDERADVSLTLGELEEFERSEAAAAEAALALLSGIKLKLKPAICPASATPSAKKSTPPAIVQTPTKAATEVEPVIMDIADSPPSSSDKWCDDEVAMEPEEDRAHGEHEPEVTCVEVWPERKRYGETVEAEVIYGCIDAVEVPVLDSLSLGNLHGALLDVVAQFNVAHKALATAGHVTAERSREALQQSKISSDLATEARLKTYETAAIASSTARQSWKMCIQLSRTHMPARSKDAERKPDTTGRYLASKLFGVVLKQEEVAISHFGGQSNEFIIKFTKTGAGTLHEALLYNSEARLSILSL